MREKQVKMKEAFRFRRFARKAYSAFNSMHRVVNFGVVGCCVLASAHTTETSAQNSSISVNQSLIEEQELEEVTVTASRIELALEKAAGLVTVISKEEVQRAPIQSIQDLLNYASGIDVQQRGTHGVQADISIRGGSFDQTAILLNGFNLSNPQTGHYSFDIPILLSDIERIEIINGPSSLVYGSSAFSGGINIITKKNQPSGFSAYTEAGSYGLWGAEVSGSLQNGITNNTLSFGYNRSDGYIDNSDYDIYNLFWQTGLKLETSKLDIQFGYNNKQYGANTFYSASYPNQYDETSSIFTGIKAETGGRLKIIPRIYWNRHYDCFQLIRGNQEKVPYNYHRSDVFGLDVDMQYPWAAGITGVSANLRNEGIESSVLGKPMSKPDGHYTHSDNRSEISYVLEHNFLFRSFTATAGILANYNSGLEQENFRFYPAINIAYRFNENWKIFTGWKKALRMPTFTDLYYNTATHTGNPDLLPEKSESLELGVKYSNYYIQAFTTGFWMKGSNLIDWDKESPDAKWKSQNIGTVKKYGIESGATILFHKIFTNISSPLTLNIGYNYLYQNPDGEKEMISAYVFNYLKHKFTSQLNHPVFKNITANWYFRWEDRQGTYVSYVDTKAGDTVSYKDFSILDFNLLWNYNSFKFNLAANNIFDVTYCDIGNIPQPGFWISAGVRYKY